MEKNLIEIGRLFDTDKTESLGYADNYERHFGHLRDKPVKLLELGVYHGGSLLMWNEYFQKGRAVGLDLSPNPLKTLPERVRFYQGSQDDIALLSLIAEENAPEGFDIIIDDAAHVGTIARQSFRTLFDNHLKPGGTYVIEDWGTGYWKTWPDGSLYHHAQGNRSDKRSGPASFDPNFAVHNFGMVGFIKELVDQVAWGDITRPGFGNSEIASATSVRFPSFFVFQASGIMPPISARVVC